MEQMSSGEKTLVKKSIKNKSMRRKNCIFHPTRISYLTWNILSSWASSSAICRSYSFFDCKKQSKVFQAVTQCWGRRKERDIIYIKKGCILDTHVK